jgi:hypothetical protein
VTPALAPPSKKTPQFHGLRENVSRTGESPGAVPVAGAAWLLLLDCPASGRAAPIKSTADKRRLQEEGMRLIGWRESRESHDCSVRPVTEKGPPVTAPAA